MANLGVNAAEVQCVSVVRGMGFSHSGSLKNVRIVCEKNTLTVSSQARFAFWKRLKSFDGKQF